MNDTRNGIVKQYIIKRNKKTALFILAFICLITLLTGCGKWTQRFYSDKHLAKIAQKTLYEKYNEDFEVRNIYQQVWTEFYAVCSPVKDDTVVFEARLFKDGRLIYDYYLEEIIVDEIRDEVSKCLDGLWGDYYIDGIVSHISNMKEQNKEISLKSYVEFTYDMAQKGLYNYRNTYSSVIICDALSCDRL